MIEAWSHSQHVEESFWGTCSNTYGEETKQLLYLREMGFKRHHDGNSPFVFHGGGRSFVDIGGGPCSSLLKFQHCRRRVVVDPCPYPDWVVQRYQSCGISFCSARGESLLHLGERFDVALIYNVLQHTEDPALIIANALLMAKQLCLFEWIDIPAHPGHPHELTHESLEKWTGRTGVVREFHGENECYGKAFILGE